VILAESADSVKQVVASCDAPAIEWVRDNGKGDSKMYFILYKDTAGYWRWTLKAPNHEPIAVSSESYARKADAEHGIGLTKSAHNAPVRELNAA